MEMIVVSDTSPISNLAAIGKLELLVVGWAMPTLQNTFTHVNEKLFRRNKGRSIRVQVFRFHWDIWTRMLRPYNLGTLQTYRCFNTNNVMSS